MHADMVGGPPTLCAEPFLCRRIPVDGQVFHRESFWIGHSIYRKIANGATHLRRLGMASKWLLHPQHIPYSLLDYSQQRVIPKGGI